VLAVFPFTVTLGGSGFRLQIPMKTCF